MLMEFRSQIGVGDRVVTRFDILGTDRLANRDYVPQGIYGTVVGIRDTALFVDFDEILHLVRRKVVQNHEVEKVFPASFVRRSWDTSPWQPKTGELNGYAGKEQD